jgi:hypothetical protein
MFPVIDRLRVFLRKLNERDTRFHLIGTPKGKAPAQWAGAFNGEMENGLDQ